MLEFATRGTNPSAEQSKQICGNIKAGNAKVIERLIYHIEQLPKDHPITLMFEDNPILVPALGAPLWLKERYGLQKY